MIDNQLQDTKPIYKENWIEKCEENIVVIIVLIMI